MLNDLEDAVEIIDQLIVAAPNQSTELRELRKRVSSGLVTKLFNEELERNLAMAKFANELETQERKSGCLIPLALIVTGIAGSGGALVWLGMS